jgi:hypothetical protein
LFLVNFTIFVWTFNAFSILESYVIRHWSSRLAKPKTLEMVANAGTKMMLYKGVINGFVTFGDAWYDPNLTNAGTKMMLYHGVIHGFGDAWYDPNQVANILGFPNLEDNAVSRMILVLKRRLTSTRRL